MAAAPRPTPRPTGTARRSAVVGWSFVAVDTATRLGEAFAAHAVKRWQPNLAKTAGRVAATLVSRAVALPRRIDTGDLSGLREVTLWVMREARWLVVMVWDSDPTAPPDPRGALPDAYLTAVTREGMRWDWYYAEGGGKVIRAELEPGVTGRFLV